MDDPFDLSFSFGFGDLHRGIATKLVVKVKEGRHLGIVDRMNEEIASGSKTGGFYVAYDGLNVFDERC